MGLFGKKCGYCRSKIDKGKEISRDVKIPGFVGTFRKSFCSENHADIYQKETEEKLKTKGGGCCH